MARISATSLAVALAASAAFFAGGVVDAEAQTRNRARTAPVLITPNYLSAGQQVAPFERREFTLPVTAGYISTGRTLPGRAGNSFTGDAFYHGGGAVFRFDSGLGSKFPGER
jgi:hypothetical protein